MQLAAVGTHTPVAPWHAVVGLKQPALGAGSAGDIVGMVGSQGGGSGGVARQLIVPLLPIAAQPPEMRSTVQAVVQSALVEHDTVDVHCLVCEVQLHAQLLPPGSLR
jgi:hypothetical protein